MFYVFVLFCFILIIFQTSNQNLKKKKKCFDLFVCVYSLSFSSTVSTFFKCRSFFLFLYVCVRLINWRYITGDMRRRKSLLLVHRTTYRIEVSLWQICFHVFVCSLVILFFSSTQSSRCLSNQQKQRNILPYNSFPNQ